MPKYLIAGASVGLLAAAAAACSGQPAVAGEAAIPQSTSQTANPQPALAALDAIPAGDWLTTSSKALLERILAASSKEALDEAAKTDPRAQALVGSGYFFGLSGYPQNDAEAEKFYRLGAVSNPIAQINFGAMMGDGRASADGKPAPGAAADYNRMAAEQGHPVAQTNLGNFYRDGTGVARDETEAARWFAMAAKQDNPAAQYALGQLYFDHRGAEDGAFLEDDWDEAERLFRAASDKENADALAAMGKLLNFRSILEQMEIVDTVGNAVEPAIDCYGNLESSGDCDTGEIDEAAVAAHDSKKADLEAESKRYYQRALAAYERDADILNPGQGSPYAMGRLGDMHYKGEGTAKDFGIALTHYNWAADAGNDYALAMIGHMVEIGEGVQKDEAEAVSIYRELAQKDDANGEINLGRMYDTGAGELAADHAEALRLYKLSARHGNTDAQDHLKKLGETW